MGPLFVLGDVHGQYEKMVRVLRQAGLIGTDERWTGRDATLWCMGDFFDRGPHGTASVALVMRLQQEAREAGGQVDSLMGNHEPLILAALRFGERPAGGPGGTFTSDWLRNGGVVSDLDELTAEQIDWLIKRPAMVHVGSRLLVHADAMFYVRYGSTVAEVNRAFRSLLEGDDEAAWDQLLGDFSERDAWLDSKPDGRALAEQFLRTYGGEQIIHGHSPICRATGQPPEAVTGPLVYAGGLCVNVDHGMMLGGEGFVYEVKV